MAVRPLEQIFLRDPVEVSALLKRRGAMYLDDKSSFNRWIYWSGHDRVWIRVTPQRGGYRIETFKGCPC